MIQQSDVIPKIVLLGPTNVGKSALFNRLTRTRAAIVCDRPGVTVDRHELIMEDSPAGRVKVVDTGGVGPTALLHTLGKEIERAAASAVAEASIILFVVDGTRELGIEEFEVATWLRKQKGIDNKTVWVIANKVDVKKFDASSYYSLGFEKLVEVSAEHALNIGDLWDLIALQLNPESAVSSGVELIPESDSFDEDFDDADDKETKEEMGRRAPSRVVVLGRPNVGKSTLLNTILGEERHVVSQMAGTTREPIESDYFHKDIHFKLVDTAGLRQPGRLERDVEWVAREKLKDMARQAEIAVVLLDSTQGVTDLDCAIIGMAIDFGLSVVLAFNKWDLMAGDSFEDMIYQLGRSTDLKLEFAKWCPVAKISALTGKGIGDLIKKIHMVAEARKTRVQTSKLNVLFERKFRLHHHPLASGNRIAKFYYLSQVAVSPPEFVLFANIPGKEVHFSYRRFVTNSLRTEFGFEGTPIKLHFKTARASSASASR